MHQEAKRLSLTNQPSTLEMPLGTVRLWSDRMCRQTEGVSARAHERHASGECVRARVHRIDVVALRPRASIKCVGGWTSPEPGIARLLETVRQKVVREDGEEDGDTGE